MLEVSDLCAFYGKGQVLHGVNLHVKQGEIVSILGRNGAGRSTVLRAIVGAVRTEGVVRFCGEQVQGLKSFEIARRGIGYVPEERAIFPNLTVLQNLLLGEKRSGSGPRWQLEDTWTAFPQLRQRANILAGLLSGGEQQMLTICRTLMGNPKLIMIDEPTEGLAPQMVQNIRKLLKRITASGVAILLVEQKLTLALDVSHRLYVMGHGEIVFEGTPAAFRSDKDVQYEWLEV